MPYVFITVTLVIDFNFIFLKRHIIYYYGKWENRRKERGTKAYKEQRKVLSPVFREFENRSERFTCIVLNRVNAPSLPYFYFIQLVFMDNCFIQYVMLPQ
jgi:hypothetical protein